MPKPDTLDYATPQPKPSALAFMLRAFNSRNYSLFFAGQLVSLVGTWLSSLALSWLIYRITGSRLLLGTVAFCTLAPAFFVGPFAGVMIDRWNLRKLMIVTQSLSMLQSFLLAFLVLGGYLHDGRVWPIFVLACFQGLVNGFDMPGRQAFVVQLVDRREDLPNAIALNSSMFNLSRLLGPALGGVLVAVIGEGWCFFIDGVSYAAVIVAFLVITVAPRVRPKVEKKVLHDLKEGIVYAWNFKPIRNTLLLLAFVALLGAPYGVLMPVFADDILHGDATTFGFLSAAGGVGSFCGAILLATRRSVVGLGNWIIGGAVFFGLALVGFSQSSNLFLSMALLVLVGFGGLTVFASCNTVLQTLTDDDKRGRVMSLFTTCFQGTMPVGSLAAGYLGKTEVLGAPLTVAAGGVLCVIVAVYFGSQLPKLRPMVRPIYEARGILPPIATGVQAATAMTGPKTE